ncbi:MAG: ABC transporter permease [Clostridia bacterium]|nr:ABC transporter permease [Clostridia bacterium]
MRGVLTVMKKELRRFFTDTRMVFTVLLLPGFLIYVMYSFMGSAMTGMFTVDEEYRYQLGVSEESEYLNLLLPEIPADVQYLAETEGVVGVKNGVLDLYIGLSADFDTTVTAYDVATGESAPQIALYFNSADTNSQSAYTMMYTVLDDLEAALTNKFDVNGDPAVQYDLAEEEETSAMFLSMLMPLLLTMLLFTGSMSVAMESIAGEKERGTMAALLITPVKRSSIAMGKILALGITAFASGIVTTGFVMASVPKLMGEAVEIDANIYSVGDYAMLMLVVISTVLLYVTAISLLSALAKSVKEAQALVTPLMMVVVFVGLTAMLSQTAPTETYWYCIPLYNSVQSMLAIFSAEGNAVNTVVSVAVNLAISGVGILALAKIFDNERIIFNK